MKVITINGSPRKNGNTAIALDEVSESLHAEGIATERIDIGSGPLRGCIACRRCGREKDRRCVFDDDPVNETVARIAQADGVLIGSPVYFAGINGLLKSFLDRVFFVAGANDTLFRHKVGAGVVAVRRGGETTAWDQLNKYFTNSEMLVPTGPYWNMLFGMEPGEGKQDLEGLYTMRVLGANMAWLLKLRAGEAAAPPPYAQKVRTNFIR